jgi:hypothetical protein
MANILFGGGIADARGSIAGTVFSKNRFGSYIRNRTKPVNPNSPRQQAVRNILAYVVNYWSQQLTNDQRAKWDVYADNVNWQNKLGQTVKLTGFNHFCRCNVARQTYGYSIMDDGPDVLVLPGTDADFKCTCSETTQQVTVEFDDTADWCSEDSGCMSIHQGLPKNSAISFYGNHFRYLGIIEGNSASPISSPQSLALDWPVAETQKDWFFGEIQRADGRLSIPFRDNCSVSA